jgi:anti-sigma factor RsiW
MINCKQVAHDLTELEEGNLPVSQRALLRLHLAICPMCKVYVRQMKATVAALQEADEPMSDEASSALAKKLLARKREGGA